MFEFLVYLAQSAICLATLYLIYKVAMSYETLHSFNRVLASPDKILADAVEQTFKSAPQEWAAGEENGQKVREKYIVPIVFTPVSK